MTSALVEIVTVAAGSEQAFEGWHTAGHVPWCLARPEADSVRVRRFVSVAGTRQAWCVLAEGDSQAEIARLGTDAARHVPAEPGREVLRDVTVASCDIATVRYDWCPSGANGGYIGVWRLTAPPRRRPGLFARLYEAVPTAAAKVAGAVRVAVLDAADAGLVLLAEGHSLASTAQVCQSLQPLQAHGAAAGDVLDFFGLQIDATGSGITPTS